MNEKMNISAIGEVKRKGNRVILLVKPEYKDAMKGLDMFSHISVL